MYYVYIIQSEKTKELYFGLTSDVKKRLEDHNKNRNRSTKDKGHWFLVYLEAYRSKKDAIIREKKLKEYGNARTYVKKRIQNSLK